MKRAAIACALMLPLLAWGQSGSFGLTLKADYVRYTMPEIDLNDFYRSYNAYYGSNMKVPFDTLSPTEFSHPAFGAGIRFISPGNLGFSTGLFITYGTNRFSQESTFQNDIITRTDILVKDLTFQTDVGFHISSVLFLHGLMAGHIRNTVFDLGYFYQDGSYTLGNEYDILGVYTAPTITLDLGVGAMLKLGRIIIPVSLSYPTNFASDDGLIDLTDYDIWQIRWADIPRDFRTWADDPANLDLDTGFVRARSLRSVRLNIGIEFLLGSKFDEL